MARMSRVEQILSNIVGPETELPEAQSRVEELLLQLNEATHQSNLEHANLTGRIISLESAVSSILTEQIAQNTAIDASVADSDIVICSQAEYDALSNKTALLYLIPEED